MQNDNTRTMAPVLIGAAVILVIILVVIFSMSTGTTSTAVYTNHPAGPRKIPNITGTEQAMQQYAHPGTNGKLGVSFSYPGTWNLTDKTVAHKGLWIELTRGRASILINQESMGNLFCIYPPQAGKNSGLHTADDVEEFGAFTEVKTSTGQVFRIAPQHDYSTSYYVCQQNRAPDGSSFGTLTSIGQIRFSDPDSAIDKKKDLETILRSMQITLE